MPFGNSVPRIKRWTPGIGEREQTMGKRPYTPIPDEWLEEMGELGDAEYGRLIRWCQTYNITGEEGKLNGNERFYLKRCKNALDRFLKVFDDLSNNRSEAGKKGADARWGKNGKGMANDSKPRQTDGKNGYTETNTNTNTKTNSITPPIIISPPAGDAPQKSSPKFSPPSVEDVREYCLQNCIDIDADQFVDFYASKGWKVGRNPMKDWKAAVRNWARRDRETGKNKPKYTKNGMPVKVGPLEGGDDLDRMARLFGVQS